MNSKISIISHLFSSLLYVCFVAAVGSIDYPDQKYVLFTKLPDGRMKKVATFNEPIDKDQAVSMYGKAPYTLQSMKPRIKIIWSDL